MFMNWFFFLDYSYYSAIIEDFELHKNRICASVSGGTTLL